MQKIRKKVFTFRYGQSIHLLFKEDDDDGDEAKLLKSEDIWNQNFYRKIEFSLSKSITYLCGGNFMIRNDKEDLLLSYSDVDSNIDLTEISRKSKKRSRSFIHDALSVRSRSHASNIYSLKNVDDLDKSKNKPTCSRLVKVKSKVRAGKKQLKKQFSNKNTKVAKT